MYYPVDFVLVKAVFYVNPQSSQMKSHPNTERMANSIIGRKIFSNVGMIRNYATS